MMDKNSGDMIIGRLNGDQREEINGGAGLHPSKASVLER